MNSKMSLDYSKPEAWTLVPLSSSPGYCDSGTHTLPLFSGGPRDDVMKKLVKDGVNVQVDVIILIISK